VNATNKSNRSKNTPNFSENTSKNTNHFALNQQTQNNSANFLLNKPIESESEHFIGMMKSNSKPKSPLIKIKAIINSQNVDCVLDIGATTSVMSKQTQTGLTLYYLMRNL
jgi:hypothetical protein